MNKPNITILFLVIHITDPIIIIHFLVIHITDQIVVKLPGNSFVTNKNLLFSKKKPFYLLLKSYKKILLRMN